MCLRCSAVRIDGEGIVHLEEGEIVPTTCANCGYLWQPAIDENTVAIKCPLCSTEMRVEDLPAWELKE